MARIILFLHTIYQINALTGKCGIGNQIEPVKTCQTILDCYNGDKMVYLRAMETKFTKWCNKDGGICCQGNNDDHTCPDGITPRFGEDPCTAPDGENCNKPNKSSGVCWSKKCCPGLSHEFATNVVCFEDMALVKKYQWAYCKDGIVHYTSDIDKNFDDSSRKCGLNEDCGPSQVCLNTNTTTGVHMDRYCILDPLITFHSDTMFWIILAILIIVPIIIIIICTATCIFCIEMIFCVVVVGILIFFLGVAGVTGAAMFW